jgi:hypothetical protein
VAARGVSAACGWFGFALGAAAAFDVFYRIQVTNYRFLYVLFESTPNRLDYMDVWVLSIHVQTASRLLRGNVLSNEFRAEQAEKLSRRSPKFHNATTRMLRASLVLSSRWARSDSPKETP